MSKPDSKGTLIRIRPNNSISKTTYHDEPLLYKLQLLYKLLLLYLQLTKSISKKIDSFVCCNQCDQIVPFCKITGHFLR